MLIALPIPVILQVRLSLLKKFQLGFLFSIGLMIVIITAIRIPFTIRARDSETIRISWTTGEFLAATFVANAPKLYSFKHIMKRRKMPMRKFSRSAGPHIRGSREPDDLDDLDETVMSVTEVATPGTVEVKEDGLGTSARSEELPGVRRDS